MAEQVIIEFVSDASQLQPAVDKLEQLGQVEKSSADQFKATNKTIADQGKVMKLTADEFKRTGLTLEQLAAKVKKSGTESMSLVNIEKSLKTELSNVTTQVKQTESALDKQDKTIKSTTTSTLTLKSQLRQLVEQLAQMKVQGQDNTEQYRLLAQQAGKLKDAIGDANQEVKNFGSDTSTLDGIISLTGGVAGGFAAVQGAAALFGDQSEELQKTLLRVNAAMAILQGLQQLQIVLQKESAAATLINTIATKAQAAALTLYNFVVGSSIGLMKAFRIALAATGVGLLVLGIVELISALKSQNDELKTATDLIEHEKNVIESLNNVIDQRVSIEEAQARARNARESELISIQGKRLLSQRKGLEESNQILAAERDAVEQGSEAWANLNDKIFENNEAIKNINTQTVVKSIELEKQLATERLENIAAGFAAQLAGAKKNSKDELEIKKLLAKAERDVALNASGLTENERLKIITESNKKIRDLNREFQVVLQNDRIAAIEASLSNEQTKARERGERIGQTEIDLQKKLIQEKADLELLQEGLTASQVLEIKTKSLNDQIKLQRDFNKQSEKEAIEDIISRNNKELSALEVSDAKKLSLTIENITAAAKIEVDANLGNTDKIKEINAKRDADIRAAKIASIQAVAEYEIQITKAKSGVLLRGIQDELDAQEKIRSASNSFERKRIEKETGFKKESVEQQKHLIDILTAYESGAIGKRIDALNEQRAKGLISEKDYNIQYETLVDEQTQVLENGEKKKTAITKAEGEKRKQQALADVQTILDVASAVGGVLESLFQLQSASENSKIADQKQQLKDLQDAGAITEKEALARQKKIDAEEKKIKKQQAEREKSIALFNAAIAIPQAALKGLTTGGPILAAVYGALALAQLLIIAARPIPRFGKGKKGSYQGPAEVGETGTELIQSNGRMYVADKPQVVWLGSHDTVFNPKETIDIMSGVKMNTERIAIPVSNSSGIKIDYDKMGKTIAKHVSTNIYVDGVQEQRIKKQEFTHWLTKRRSW